MKAPQLPSACLPSSVSPVACIRGSSCTCSVRSECAGVLQYTSSGAALEPLFPFIFNQSQACCVFTMMTSIEIPTWWVYSYAFIAKLMMESKKILRNGGPLYLTQTPYQFFWGCLMEITGFGSCFFILSSQDPSELFSVKWHK